MGNATTYRNGIVWEPYPLTNSVNGPDPDECHNVTMPSTLAITIVAMTATIRMKTISADMVMIDSLTSAPSAIPS